MRNWIPKFVLSSYHYFLALMGAFLFSFPSKKITVIGVTGTSGKTTTVEYLSKILNESGFKTASISSTSFKIGAGEEKNMLKMTMPGRFKIQRFLRKAVKEKCRYAVIEVSSQGIVQFRHKFIRFGVCVFTNLSEEHIESHGGFENYRNAKLSLFKENPYTHIINREDKYQDFFWQVPAKNKIEYGLDKRIPFNIKGFNRYNASAALTAALYLKIPESVCIRSLEKSKEIAGRVEFVAKEPFSVIVDYAHTPSQLEELYKMFEGKRKICVLGSCGGGRDKWKRPVMGKIAGKNCEKVIITNEDPYDEDPEKIIEEVAGLTPAEKILDRRKAIRRALELAMPGDAVIITGKGSEPLMCVAKGKKIPWDDRAIAREELERIAFYPSVR